MWFIHFSVFRVHEYCFHTYISTIVVQSRFWFYSQLIIHWFLLSIQFCTSNSHRHLLANKKLTQKVLGSLITSIFFSIINFFSIIIMTRLNCCKLFWWFDYVDTKNTVFVWFHFLIGMHCLQLLFVLIILKAWIIICLELKFVTLFFLFLLRHLLVVACQVTL